MLSRRSLLRSLAVAACAAAARIYPAPPAPRVQARRVALMEWTPPRRDEDIQRMWDAMETILTKGTGRYAFRMQSLAPEIKAAMLTGEWPEDADA